MDNVQAPELSLAVLAREASALQELANRGLFPSNSAGQNMVLKEGKELLGQLSLSVMRAWVARLNQIRGEEINAMRNAQPAPGGSTPMDPAAQAGPSLAEQRAEFQAKNADSLEDKEIVPAEIPTPVQEAA